MSTDPARIRPRLRGAQTAPPPNVISSAVPADEPAMPQDELCPLPVLARLPVVSVSSDPAKNSLQFDWLKNLDWKRVRRIKLGPNWVAGGVLALVLFLLLVITLNRSPKPAADTAAENEAPTWNSAGNVATSNAPAGTANGAAVSSSTGTPNGSTNVNAAPSAATNVAASPSGIQEPSFSTEPVITSHASESLLRNQFSLEGIYYPRTPYATPVGIATQPSVQEATAQRGGQPVYSDGIRTAQRDAAAPHRAPAQVSPSQSGRAQFDGRIIQP